MNTEPVGTIKQDEHLNSSEKHNSQQNQNSDKVKNDAKLDQTKKELNREDHTEEKVIQPKE
jgi:hypothetical protein